MRNGLVFIALSFLLLISACGLSSNNFSPGPLELAAIEECESRNEAEQSDCYLSFAVNISSPGLCSFIEGRTQNFCIYEVVRRSVAVSDELCTTLSNDTFWSDRCYLEVASRNAEFDALEDVQGCDNVQDVELRDGCFLAVALDTENAAVCDRVHDGLRYQNCLFGVAKTAYRPNICVSIFHKINRDICLKKLAKLTYDSSVCDLLADEGLRNSCKNYFMFADV